MFSRKKVKVNDFKIDGNLCISLTLNSKKNFDSNDNEKSEYPIKIECIKVLDCKDAK